MQKLAIFTNAVQSARNSQVKVFEERVVEQGDCWPVGDRLLDNDRAGRIRVFLEKDNSNKTRTFNSKKAKVLPQTHPL